MSEVKLTDKQKMLGLALFARKVGKAEMATILMVLENDDQIDDMTWFMSNNPQASGQQLVAVAYQLVKDAHDN